MTESRKASQVLVEWLLANGVQQAFGVPGESYLDVLDSLYDVREQIDFLCCRQEGGAAYMAEAWGKLTGEPGICFVTRGPGATNASIGIHTAMQNSTPMILFVGQVGRGERGREAFQEVDYRAFFSPICKWAVEIDDAQRIPEMIARAFAVARSGRPGPVVVALPEDMLGDSLQMPAQAASVVEAGIPSDDSMQRVKGLLQTSKKPLLLVGGAGWTPQCKQQICQFAESCDIPALSVFRFNDVFDNNSPCYVGDAGVGMTETAKQLISDADLLLAVGVRLGEMTTGAYSLLTVPRPDQQLIHVHPSPAEHGKVYQADLSICASVPGFVSSLSGISIESSATQRDRLTSARQMWVDGLNAPPQPGELDMGQVMYWLREHLPADVILTNGAGNFSVWPNKFFGFSGGARLLAPQSGAMGYGLPAAIAAKKRHPERTVVCFAGDGDFQMNCQELGSAMQAGSQPIVLVINNSMYGTIRMHQERHYPARVSGTEIVNPDFVALASAYGYHAERVTRTDQFAEAFKRAEASATGAVLDLVVDQSILTPHQTVQQARDLAGNSA